MQPKKKFQLRTAWYGLIILASVLPAVALSPWLSQQAHSLLLERAMMKEAIYHKEVETRLHLETKRLESVLLNKSDPIAYFLKQRNLEQIRVLLEKISDRESMINTTTIYDQHARLMIKSQRGDHSTAVINSDSPAFAIPMHRRSFLGSPAELDDGHYEFIISVPIIIDDKAAAVMISTIKIDEFWQTIKSSVPEHNSKIYLVDGRGSLLTHLADTRHKQGSLLSDKEIVRALLAGKNWDKQEDYLGFEETRVFGIASLIEELQWGIISEIPANSILASIITALTTLTLIVFLLHIIFGLLSLFFTKRILSPISDLADVFKIATSGDYTHDAKPSRFQEIHALTSAFNVMMHEIDHRERSLQKLHHAVDQAGESIMIASLEGKLEYVNPAFTRITGYSKEEAVGKTPGSLINSGMQSKALYAGLWQQISSGHSWEGTLTNRKKDGTLYPVFMTISPIISENKVTHFLAIQQDMSKQNMLEDQLRQSQKMESLGTLVGGIAHDFNNLLGGMTGNLYLARLKASDRPDAIEKISKVEKLSFKAAALISQLLAFARKSPVQMTSLDLNALLQDSMSLLQTSIPENISLTHHYSDQELPIQGDKTQLHQIMMNMLSNAKDAVSGNKHAHIHISLKPFTANDAFHKYHPHHIQTDNYALLTVKDNGHGMSAEQIERIFEPFYTTKDVGEGSGLGLSMIYGAIQTHDAIIDVDSMEAQGTSFHMYFPLLEIINRQEETSALVNHSGQGELILVVDDEQELCETCVLILESQGYKAISARNGSEGLNRYIEHQSRIRLVLSDIVMPNMGGVEMMRRIRLLDANIPVIFMTGYDKEQLSAETAMANSMVTSKPVDIDELNHHIGNLLRSNRNT